MAGTSNEPLLGLNRLDELMRAAFEELVARDGNAHSRDVLEGVAKRVKLTPIELAPHANGVPRWQTNVRFYTTDCVRAGYLQKANGYWKLTELGREALKQPTGQLIRSATKRYREWKATQSPKTPASSTELKVKEAQDETVVPVLPHVEKADTADKRRESFERAEEEATSGIEEHIHQFNPYAFQDLVGHLLTAMGYFVSHTAQPGRDGGIDLVVYKDALGTITPRVKVQVKHRRDSKVDPKDVRELQGLLQNGDEVGLIVSTGGFTNEARREARTSAKHVDLIDLERFVELWQRHYDRLAKEGQGMLPLSPIYFLAPIDE